MYWFFSNCLLWVLARSRATPAIVNYNVSLSQMSLLLTLSWDEFRKSQYVVNPPAAPWIFPELFRNGFYFCIDLPLSFLFASPLWSMSIFDSTAEVGSRLPGHTKSVSLKLQLPIISLWVDWRLANWLSVIVSIHLLFCNQRIWWHDICLLLSILNFLFWIRRFPHLMLCFLM